MFLQLVINFSRKKWLSVSLHLPKHRCLPAAWSCLVRMRGVGSTIFSRGATWLRWFPRLLHVLSRLLRARVPVWKLYFIGQRQFPTSSVRCAGGMARRGMRDLPSSRFNLTRTPCTKMVWPMLNFMNELVQRNELGHLSVSGVVQKVDFFSRKVVGQLQKWDCTSITDVWGSGKKIIQANSRSRSRGRCCNVSAKFHLSIVVFKTHSVTAPRKLRVLEGSRSSLLNLEVGLFETKCRLGLWKNPLSLNNPQLGLTL